MTTDIDAWKAYAADFDAMSDQEIEHETRIAENDLAEAESWLEAVASWEAAGRPRSIKSNPTSKGNENG